MRTRSQSKSPKPDRLILRVEAYYRGGARRHLYTRSIPANSQDRLADLISEARDSDARDDAVRLRAAG